MAILWQTGEPPCGVELLVEYVYIDDEIGVGDKPVRAVYRYLGQDDLAHITVLRWSTLDAAPDVLGRLDVSEFCKERASRLMAMHNDIGDPISKARLESAVDVYRNVITFIEHGEPICGGTDGA